MNRVNRGGMISKLELGGALTTLSLVFSMSCPLSTCEGSSESAARKAGLLCCPAKGRQLLLVIGLWGKAELHTTGVHAEACSLSFRI